MRDESDHALVALSSLATVNPPGVLESLLPTTNVSFIPMSDVTENGEWVERQTRPLRQVQTAYTPFLEGDVLFAKITPCMENGKGAHALGLISGVGFGSTEFHVLRARAHAHSRFIYHWCQSRALRLKAEAFMTGSAGQRRVQTEFFDNFMVAALPLAAQCQVADTLDSIDDVIRDTEKVIVKHKLVKHGMLHDLLTRGIGESGELRPPPSDAPCLYKDSTLGRIPTPWNVRTLGEIVSSTADGPFGSNLKSEHYVAQPGVRVVRLQNIGAGCFLDADRAYISDAHARSLRRHAVVAGDLLVASLGDEAHPIARACLYPPDQTPGIVKADCFRVRADPRTALNGYLAMVLNCPSTRGDVDALAQGVTRDRVNLTGLRSIRLRVPALDEQNELVDRLGTLDARLSLEAKTVNEYRQLKLGLTDDLLEGRVRVRLPSAVVP